VTYVPSGIPSFFRSQWLGGRIESSPQFIGVNERDYSGYPDCRPEFIEAYERMANLATKTGSRDGPRVKIYAAAGVTKRGIVNWGAEVGLDFGSTFQLLDPLAGWTAVRGSARLPVRRKGSGRGRALEVIAEVFTRFKARV